MNLAGIEVSKGESVTTGGSLVFAVDADVVNDTEADGLPTIWIDGVNGGTVTGSIVEKDFTRVEVQIGDKTQTHYYLDAANAVTPTQPTAATEILPATEESVPAVELQPAEEVTDAVEATEAE